MYQKHNIYKQKHLYQFLFRFLWCFRVNGTSINRHTPQHPRLPHPNGQKKALMYLEFCNPPQGMPPPLPKISPTKSQRRQGRRLQRPSILIPLKLRSPPRPPPPPPPVLLPQPSPPVYQPLPRGSIVVPFWDYLIGF